MARLAVRYPGYGWEHNAGYATPDHREALATLGPTPFHRRSFAPVQAAIHGAQLGFDLPDTAEGSGTLVPPVDLDLTLVVDIDAATANDLAALMRETDPARVTAGG
jgi:hypothetical protein